MSDLERLGSECGSGRRPGHVFVCRGREARWGRVWINPVARY